MLELVTKNSVKHLTMVGFGQADFWSHFADNEGGGDAAFFD